MSTDFRATADGFAQSLDTIADLVTRLDKHDTPRDVRIAAVNAAMLLLAATFEDFVREMATSSARRAVDASDTIADVPARLRQAAWRRTFRTIADTPVPQASDGKGVASAATDAEQRTSALLDFVRGDLKANVYDGLVHNDGAMRFRQINSLFRISDVRNVCALTSGHDAVITHFHAADAKQSAGDLRDFLDGFIDQRNGIAHELNTTASLAARDVENHIAAFRVFADSLCDTLEEQHGV